MTYKLTVDINLMDPGLAIPGMETLKLWKEEGKVDLVEAAPSRVAKEPAYNWPGAPPRTEPEEKPAWGRKSRQDTMKKSGKADFKSISSVLFPYKDHSRLNITQINCIAHLLKHHSTKNHVFVTANRKDFIDEGRREILLGQFGIQILTPEETVKMLREVQGWDAEVAKDEAPPAKQRKKKKA